MSFAISSVAIMGAGVAMNTMGAYSAAKGQQIALRGQADIADTNARLTELQAQSSLLAGQRQEQSVRLKTAHLKSTQRASMAANGIDLGSDSAVNILSSTDMMGEIDADTVQANAVRSAWGYRTQELNFQNDALMKRATADSINPGMQAAATFLSSAGQVAGNWYMMNKAGAFNSTDVAAANKTDDPILSLGRKRNWWSGD